MIRMIYMTLPVGYETRQTITEGGCCTTLNAGSCRRGKATAGVAILTDRFPWHHTTQPLIPIWLVFSSAVFTQQSYRESCVTGFAPDGGTTVNIIGRDCGCCGNVTGFLPLIVGRQYHTKRLSVAAVVTLLALLLILVIVGHQWTSKDEVVCGCWLGPY